MLTEFLPRVPEALSELSPVFADFGGRFAKLPEKTRVALIKSGEERAGFAWPAITAADYMEFEKSGNRTRFEAKYFERRLALCELALAEYAERKGRFLPELINGVWCVCEESGWQLPPHNNYVRDTQPLPLPDVSRPVPELFSCETGAALAVIRQLLGDELNAVSSLICERIAKEINARLIAPYLTSRFWWMGNGAERMCNWTPWCTQNMLIAVFLTGQPNEIKRRVIAQACESLDCFLKDYGEDGCCEEGALYYRHAGLTLWGALEILNKVADGAFLSVFDTPKVKNIASYIKNVHIGGDWYFNYGDCGPKPGLCGAREYFFGKRVGDAGLTRLALSDISRRTALESGEINIAYRLLDIFFNERDCAGPKETPETDVFYPSTGLWAARDDVWRVSARAGGNGGSHGHCDAGSVIVFRGEKPVLIDIGVESYTAKTFSKTRGELWTIRSDWHNLPTIGEKLQKTGAEYGAANIKTTQNGNISEISMQLAGAYSKAPGFSYRRTLTLAKNESLELRDEYDGEQKAVLSLIFCEKPELLPGTLRLSQGVRLMVSGGGAVEMEMIEITDARLRQGWPEKLYRVKIEVKNKLSILFKSENEEEKCWK